MHYLTADATLQLINELVEEDVVRFHLICVFGWIVQLFLDLFDLFNLLIIIILRFERVKELLDIRVVR